MELYENLKNKHNELIKSTLVSNKKNIIDSLVEFYGEKHRSLIEQRYEEIVFVYYVHYDSIKYAVNKFIKYQKDKTKYNEIINFYKSTKKINSFFNKFIKSSKSNIKLPSNLIGSTNEEIYNEEEIRSHLFSLCNKLVPISYNYGSIQKMYRIISFQILNLSDVDFFHEINHAITRDNMIYIVNDDPKFNINLSVTPVHKTGVSLNLPKHNNIESNLEELLNEKAAIETTKIFNQKGVSLNSIFLDIPFSYTYEKNFYLIDEFYETFKKEIIEARISDNLNILINKIGKNNYEDFVKLVNTYFSKDKNTIEKNKELAKDEIHKLIEKMKNEYNNSKDISKEELKKYYDNLKTYGNNIRILNDLPDEKKENYRVR